MTNSIKKDFKGLPIEDLIGAPLISIAKAQGSLALTTSDFIEEFQDDSFIFKKKIDDKKAINIEVPALACLNIPSLAVTKVNIDFSMSVASQDKSNATTKAGAKVSAKGGWGPVKATMSGYVSTDKTNTRTTDKSAKYNISVEAIDKGTPEGLSKIMQMLVDKTYESEPKEDTEEENNEENDEETS